MGRKPKHGYYSNQVLTDEELEFNKFLIRKRKEINVQFLPNSVLLRVAKEFLQQRYSQMNYENILLQRKVRWLEGKLIKAGLMKPSRVKKLMETKRLKK